MIARELHFSRSDLLAAEWTELVQVWLPQAAGYTEVGA